MRNFDLLEQLKHQPIRMLVIDDNQMRFNTLTALLEQYQHQVQALLLDDLDSFEKQLQQPWDLIIFGRAYDLKIEHALSLIDRLATIAVPLLMLCYADEPTQIDQQLIYQGIYDVLNLDQLNQCYISILRALNFSGLQYQQQQLLESFASLQNQTKALSEHSHKAMAHIYEGIHMHANQAYLSLFGLDQEDELIGLPLLDLLQPEDINDFKTRFNKINQGYFDPQPLTLNSQHPQLIASNPITLELTRHPDYADGVQIYIHQQSEQLSQALSTQVPPPTSVQAASADQLINQYLELHPAPFNAFVLFSLAKFPVEALQTHWQTPQDYFKSMYDFLIEQTHAAIFELDPPLYAGLVQAHDKAELENNLMALTGLLKPQLLAVEQATYPMHLRIGYCLLPERILDAKHLQQLMDVAFSQSLAAHQHERTEDNTALNLEQVNLSPSLDLLGTLRQCLSQGNIQLNYQQIYDKHDQYLYQYEVTRGFIYENTWHSLDDLPELDQDPELSIQVDRWILVEAAKQLHHLIQQYPQAKLIINLNKHILLHDPTFPNLLAKLLSIIHSPEASPICLQFSENDISQHFADSQKQLTLLQQHPVALSLRHFGCSMYSDSILKQIDIHYLRLHQQLTQLLENENSTLALQQRLEKLQEIRVVDILLSDLNDMTLFANAWNVDARYLQGDYFQKKRQHFTNDT